jgi:hypothetical protein
VDHRPTGFGSVGDIVGEFGVTSTAWGRTLEQLMHEHPYCPMPETAGSDPACWISAVKMLDTRWAVLHECSKGGYACETAALHHPTLVACPGLVSWRESRVGHTPLSGDSLRLV